jgi:hypothetical protein
MMLNFVTQNILQLQDQRLQLYRLSQGGGDFFEISYFEGPGRIFRTRHPRPLERFFSRFISPTHKRTEGRARV